ncbi:MAG: ABC transporter substrate-binding protein [Acidobacteriia bacterium]|nr:ABC transporter substrate-binding protein [Terriglobia bacterium]
MQIRRKCSAAQLLLLVCASSLSAEDLLVTSLPPGRYGGDLVVAERSEPKVLNPVIAVDSLSREVIGLMMADLVHINRESQRTEPALARSVDISEGGRRFIVHLRRGLRFSDGHPFDADDVLFSFQVYLDENIHSPQRDLLIIGGKPVSLTKQDQYTVAFAFAQPYGPGERLFDGFPILPRHLLIGPYKEGKLNKSWGLNMTAGEFAGLGPFRYKEYVPGQRLVVERNPYYWKQDSARQRLPYLNRIIFEYVGNEDAQVLRFQSGDADIISRISAANFETLSKQANGVRRLIDAGPSLEYTFLFFNLNDLSNKSLPQIESKQGWFRDLSFRRAVSMLIDRQSIDRLVYAGRAAPISTHVTPGNKLWASSRVTPVSRSLETARSLLASAGFSWNAGGKLIDGAGRPVGFSIVTNTGNNERLQMATMIQQDLEQAGITVRVVSLEFRSLLDRLMTTFNYEACVLGLASGDVDPGSEMSVWPSDGSTHLWDLSKSGLKSGWQMEIDHLMASQMRSTDRAERKRMYDRVQELIAGNLPIIPLVSPDVLAGAKAKLKNFSPAVLLPYVLWNIEELYWSEQ